MTVVVNFIGIDAYGSESVSAFDTSARIGDASILNFEGWFHNRTALETSLLRCDGFGSSTHDFLSVTSAVDAVDCEFG